MTSRPFLSRLILPFALVVVLIVSASGAVIYFTGARAVRLQQIQDLNQLTTRLRDRLAGNTLAVTPTMREQLKDYASLLGARLTLIDGGGKVVFDSAASIEGLPNHNDRPEVIAARTAGSGAGVRFSATLHDDAMYVAELLDVSQPNGFVVRLSYPRGQWAGLNVPVWAIVGGGAIATLISVALLSFILNRQWIAPVRRLAMASEKLAAGDWATRVEPAGADDLRFFSARLNQVAINLQKQLVELRLQRGDLQAVVDTLPDPILLTDPQQRILLINSPAAKLLAISPSQAIGKTPVSVVSDEAILELFDQVSIAGAGGEDEALKRGDRASSASSTENFQNVSQVSRDGPLNASDASDSQGAPRGSREGSGNASGDPQSARPAPRERASSASDSQIAQRTLRPSTTPSATDLQREIRLTRNGTRLVFQSFATRTAGGGALVVLRDVTTLANTVQMKTDFVANASHELRTPIAAIKIAFETLQDVYSEDPVQTQRCVQIIAGHLQRLEEMLRDLLDLSRVERPDLSATAGPVTAADLFGLLRSAMTPMAISKLVELKFEQHPASARFISDERLLNLVLKNLVENSIKYTAAGGSVTVSVAAEPHTVAIKVIDTGIGIPQEHLDRVFERFYQVNAARTGSSGRGTGLGLAIVKHAIAALGGTVMLESTVNVGTTVTCTLPQGEAIERVVA